MKKKCIGHLTVFVFSYTILTSVQSLSRIWLFATPWIAACQASLSITNSRSLPKLMSIELVMPSSHLILCRPLLLLPPIPPSIRVFSNESTLHMRWPKYWSFSFSIIPSKEIPGLISFRMNWLDLLAVQGTLKRLLQHHSSKASVLQRSAFFRSCCNSWGCKESDMTERLNWTDLKDYITTIYPAWGQLLLPENLLANPVILKCKLWNWVS